MLLTILILTNLLLVTVIAIIASQTVNAQKRLIDEQNQIIKEMEELNIQFANDLKS